MCYNIVGYAVYFRVNDFLHCSIMKELLNKEELAVIKIPTALIKNHPEKFIRLNDDEIFYEGNYYDVKKESSDNSYNYFQAMKDLSEKDWHKQLRNAQANSDKSGSEGTTTKLDVKKFSPEWCTHFCLMWCDKNSLQHFLVYTDKKRFSLCEEIVLPPPQV